FTRAFRKAFATSPSLYRRIGTRRYQLPAPNGIHFVNPGPSPSQSPKGVFEMDLFDRFAGNDSWHTKRLLNDAAKLTDEQLDRPLSSVVEILPWREQTQTLRQLLENIVFTKEVWTAALTGHPLDPASQAQALGCLDGGQQIQPTAKERRTPAAMLE